MNYWLLKSEPETFSWDDLVKKGSDRWDGVRNYTARLNLRAMKKGDQAFFYHSVKEKCIIGVVEIIKEAYPDPTATDGKDWSAVDVRALYSLQKTISLDMIKGIPELNQMELVKFTRLSVQKVSKADFEYILSIAQ